VWTHQAEGHDSVHLRRCHEAGGPNEVQKVAVVNAGQVKAAVPVKVARSQGDGASRDVVQVPEVLKVLHHGAADAKERRPQHLSFAVSRQPVAPVASFCQIHLQACCAGDMAVCSLPHARSSALSQQLKKPADLAR
jgi:hypothetical protein